jgi:hypothetical protein
MKSVILNVRIPQEIKNILIIDGKQKGKNLSDNTRDILTDHCHKLKNKDSILGGEMYNSNEFIFLFAWIMEKRRCQNNVDDIEVLNNLKKVTYKVINDESLPDSIREEFEKVHFDLKRHIKNYKTPNNSFDFCEQNGSSFDYSHLIEYVTDRAFENKIFL